MPDSIQFQLATAGHDAAIRALLRESAMAGNIAISLQREPSYFESAKREGGEHHTIVAAEGERVVCVGNIAIRPRFYNGEAVRVGYLGQLRLAASHAGRFDIVRRGYQFFRELHPTLKTDVYFTSIAADNAPAIAFLERALPGMPRYELAGELRTAVLRVRRATESPGISGSPFAIANDVNRRYQFASVWLAKDVEIDDSIVLRRDDRLCSAGLWDQRPFKQVVVGGYSHRLARWRLFYNLFARLTGRVALPPVGRTLSQAYVAHVAADVEHPDDTIRLIETVMSIAFERNIALLTVAFDARDPRWPAIRKRYRPREYVTRIYTVCWPDEAAAVAPPDGRLLLPEVALL